VKASELVERLLKLPPQTEVRLETSITPRPYDIDIDYVLADDLENPTYFKEVNEFPSAKIAEKYGWHQIAILRARRL
jgi:hypothetical protein